MLIAFIIFPIFLLCLYPTKMCTRATRCACSGRLRNALYIFMESFQGHYKNGTSGTYDYRCISSMGFILQLFVCISLTQRLSRQASCVNSVSIDSSLPLLGVSLFYAYVQPCRKRYMNVIGSLLYCIATVLLVFITISICRTHSVRNYHVILVLILIPSILFAGAMIYKVLDVLGIVGIIRDKRFFKKRIRSDIDAAEIEAEPHRLTHPTQYTPLLQ